MNSGVKVLLAVLIICLVLDVTLIVTKLGRSNPESGSAGSTNTTSRANNESTASSMIFNFSGAAPGNGNSSSTAYVPGGMSEAEMGAMALSEESAGETEEASLFSGD
ncbi:MAG: hypothetical protein IJ088_01290 [Clostridia bacterium]|nr:hypothetical protein [Clostridia bacterium]